MRVIVCGSREWQDSGMISVVLEGMAQLDRDLTIIDGGARGADVIAWAIARRLGLKHESYPAAWRERGRAAGHERNQHMLSLGADLVVAFKDGFDPELRQGGTEHMVKIARAAGVRTWVLSH